MEKIYVKFRDTNNIQDLKKAHDTDAGFDLRVSENYVLHASERKLFSTGLFVEIPKGYEIELRPRSGMATKYGINLANTPATIDSGYRGEVKICLINLSDTHCTINKGDRIAQILVHKVEPVEFVKVEELTDSSRGEGGFGSSGIQ